MSGIIKVIPSQAPSYEHDEDDLLCTENMCCSNRKPTPFLSQLYHIRYEIARFLSFPFPFLTRGIYIFGGKSVMDILVVVIFSAVCIALSRNTVGLSGQISSFIGMIQVFLGLKCNIFTFLLGISFERALFFHRILGVVVLVTSALHSYASWYGGLFLSGMALDVLMGLTALVYIFKHKNFEVFYYTHVVLYAVTIFFAILHGAATFALAGIAWLFDLILRYYLHKTSVEARAEIISCDVVRLTFPKNNFQYSAGQYCFIMVPEISMLQFHPFTICSAPHEENVQLCIRAAGDWTNRLSAIVRAKNFETTLPIHIEGPIGFLTVELFHPSYEVVVMFCGGIGVTPVASLLKTMMHKYSRDHHLKKCIVIWSVRDVAMTEVLNLHYVNPLITSDSFSKEKNFSSNATFHIEIYDTSASSAENGGAVGVPAEVVVVRGRPNVSEIFRRVDEYCAESSVSRVAVVGCGPAPLVDQVADNCRFSHVVYGKNEKKQHRVCYDLHLEEFDF